MLRPQRPWRCFQCDFECEALVLWKSHIDRCHAGADPRSNDDPEFYHPSRGFAHKCHYCKPEDGRVYQAMSPQKILEHVDKHHPLSQYAREWSKRCEEWYAEILDYAHNSKYAEWFRYLRDNPNAA